MPSFRVRPFSVSLLCTALFAATPLCAEEALEQQGETQQPGKKFQQAQDMRYGAALYHHFLGNDFDALSTLMVADERGGIAHHADNADLIKGGISLAFGLERQAAGLFEKQLHKAGDADNRQRLARFREIAWLKLAELNYRHQNWDIAAQQLEKSGALHQSTLTLNLSIRSGDLEQARTLLEMAELPLAERVLGHNNLAAALARQNRHPEAAAEYRRGAALVEAQVDAEEELRILRDKARIGAGYALALSGDYSAAALEFRSVRLNTPWSEDALLGLGWAAVNSGEHRSAVDALRYLIEQNPLSPKVQEALLALPYSYEQLERPKLALRAYQHAERQYLQALDELQKLYAVSGDLQFPLELDDALQRYGWLQDAETPALIRNNQRYLLQMMQSDRLQLQLSELRDLRQLDRVLERWQQRFPEFHNLIDEREQRRTAIVEGYRSAQYDQQVDIAAEQLAKLKASLARIERDRDALAMLGSGGEGENQGESAEYLQMVRDASKHLERLSRAGKTRPSQQKRQQQTLDRARGLLLWQASEQYHHNLWQKRKSLTTLQTQISEAEYRQQQVDLIVAKAPQLQQLDAGIDRAATRLTQQQQAIRLASEVIEAAIRNDLQTALSTAQQRVEQYMAHTRLAIARIQDASMQGLYAPQPESPVTESNPPSSPPSNPPSSATSSAPATGEESE